MKLLSYFIFFISLTFFSCNSESRANPGVTTDRGKVIAIIDGDTYDVLLDGDKTIRIRMEGVDAPEKGMPFYHVAKDYLGSLCFGKTIRLDIKGIDKHGRTLAWSFLADSTELSHEMIKAGLAWHYKEYSSDSELANLEKRARDSKIGLWADNHPMAPWLNRQLHRQGISTKDSFELGKVK